MMFGSVKLDFKWKSLASLLNMRSVIQCFSFSNFSGALGSKNYNITEYSNFLHGFCTAAGSRKSLSLGVLPSMIDIVVEEAYSSDTWMSSTKLHSITIQKTITLVVTDVRTLKPTSDTVQLVKKYSAFMQLAGSLLCSAPYHEPAYCFSYCHHPFL